MAGLDTLARMFAEAPVAQWMGARLVFSPDSTAVVTLAVRPDHIQSTNVAHGCVITFVADTSAWFTAAAACEVAVMTAGFTMNLLRPTLAGETLEGRSSVVKAGHTLVVVRTQVFRTVQGDLVAEGTFTHAVGR